MSKLLAVIRMGVWCNDYPGNALIALIATTANNIPFVYRVLAAGNLLVVSIYFSTFYCSELIEFYK